MRKITIISICSIIALLIVVPLVGAHPSHVQINTLLVGDSMASLAPWPCPRMGACGMRAEDIAQRVPIIPDRGYSQVIIVGGTNNILDGDHPFTVGEDITKLVKAVRAKFPNARIVVISPYSIREIVKSGHTIDGIHPDLKGYELIADQYNLWR